MAKLIWLCTCLVPAIVLALIASAHNDFKLLLHSFCFVVVAFIVSVLFIDDLPWLRS